MVDYEIDFKLEKIDEVDNRFIFTAQSITKDFVKEEDLPLLGMTLNKVL